MHDFGRNYGKVWAEFDYLVPHEGQDKRVERAPLGGDEDQKVPKGAAAVATLAHLADAARHPRPIERQLVAEARHEHLHAEEGDLVECRSRRCTSGTVPLAGALVAAAAAAVHAERAAPTDAAASATLGARPEALGVGRGRRARRRRVERVQDDREREADVRLAHSRRVYDNNKETITRDNGTMAALVGTFSAGTDTQAERQEQVEQNRLGPLGAREHETAAASLFQRVRLLMARRDATQQ